MKPQLERCRQHILRGTELTPALLSPGTGQMDPILFICVRL
jgi:hypothetical protein